MTHSSPAVSVLMPAYNAQKYIGEAIESILNQTYKDFELIIIDDNSSDTTWKTILRYQKKDLRIHAYRNEKNLKLSNTLNKGIALAKGKYIARMDADDWSYPDRLQKQVSFMEKHPKVGIVGGAMEIMKADGSVVAKREYNLTDAEIRKYLFIYSPYSHPLVMLRKNILLKTDLYNTIYNPAEDYDLYFQIGMYSQFANLPDTLLRYRVIENSMTTGNTKQMELKTIEIRYKYAKTPYYKMTLPDILYTMLHYCSLYLIPTNMRLQLFNALRNSRLV